MSTALRVFRGGKNRTAGLTFSGKKPEIAAELGVSANRVGKIANVLGVIAPEGQSNDYGTWIRSKSQHSNKEIMTWVYYEAGREKVKRCWKQGNVA